MRPTAHVSVNSGMYLVCSLTVTFDEILRHGYLLLVSNLIDKHSSAKNFETSLPDRSLSTCCHTPYLLESVLNRDRTNLKSTSTQPSSTQQICCDRCKPHLSALPHCPIALNETRRLRLAILLPENPVTLAPSAPSRSAPPRSRRTPRLVSSSAAPHAPRSHRMPSPTCSPCANPSPRSSQRRTPSTPSKTPPPSSSSARRMTPP